MDEMLEDLIHLASTDRTILQSGPLTQIRTNLYGQIEKPPPLTPKNEEALVTHAISARLVRLWLDTMYCTEYGRLYFAVEKAPVGVGTTKPPRDLAAHWIALCDFKHHLTDNLFELTKRWNTMLISTVTFLSKVAKIIHSRVRGTLSVVLLSLSQAMHYHWAEAIKTCKPLLKGRGSPTWKGRLLLQIAGWKLNEGNIGAIHALIEKSRRLCPGWVIDSLRLTVAVQLASRSLLSEAAYWFDDRHKKETASVAGSVCRRKLRIQRNLQAPLPSFSQVSEFRGLHIGELSRQFLMWT